jgi:hypothetical protein
MSVIHNKMIDPDNEDYILNLSQLKRYMSNDFINSEFPSNYDEFGLQKLHFLKGHIYVDKTHRYTTNSNGFRTKELSNTDLLFAGCSMTFGVGVQEEAIWGNRIAKHFNYSSINLSEPGIGVDKIISYIFSYLKKYDHPKMIICLFPDFGRMIYPMVTPLITAKNYHKKTEKHLVMHTIQLHNYSDFNSRPSFDKKPYTVEHTVPYELPLLKSINQIMILDQYCKSHNIKFYWGTWEYNLNKTITKYNEINNIYDNFVTMDLDFWTTDYKGNEKFISCHKDIHDKTNSNFNDIDDICHKDVKDKFEDTFYGGLDIEEISDYSKQRPHIGSHKHAHIADNFINFIKNKQNMI